MGKFRDAATADIDSNADIAPLSGVGGRNGQPLPFEDPRLPEDLCSFDKGCGLRVGILLWPSFTLHALSGFVDALRLAADVGDRGHQILCRWDIVAAEREQITASCGLRVSPTSRLIDPKTFTYIVVVAGRTDVIPGGDSAAMFYLHEAAAAGVPLIGICTGSFVLAEAGLLDGRRACVANYHYLEFVERYPRVQVLFDQLYCFDGDRLTCAGGLASIDLAAFLVEKHCGSNRALKISHTMLLDNLRSPTASQRILRIDYDGIADNRIIRAIALMEQHVSKPVPIASIAQRLNASERQLERLFQRELGRSPLRFFRRLRACYGYWKLLHTGASISQIAFDCGFSDHSHFTRCFADEFGETPSALRQRTCGHSPLPDIPMVLPEIRRRAGAVS